jgi:hypothetical protein
MPDPRVEDLERAAALHWQAPETEPLGEWRLRAAAGFTGRANSALPVGDPGLPLPEAVAAVEDWYRRRDLRPMIVLPRGAGPDPLPAYLAERSWVPRPGPAFVMTAEIADLPASTADVRFSPEPDAAFLGSVVPLASGPPFEAPPSLVARSLVPRSSLLGPVGAGGPSARGESARRLRPAPALPRVTAVPPTSPAPCPARPRRWPRPRPAARGGSCSRSRRATPRPARSTSGAAFATRTATSTCLRRKATHAPGALGHHEFSLRL